MLKINRSQQKALLDPQPQVIPVCEYHTGLTGLPARHVSRDFLRLYSFAVRFYRFSFCSFAARMVFFISIAMVIGPTPPGTGVMAEAMGSTF